MDVQESRGIKCFLWDMNFVNDLRNKNSLIYLIKFQRSKNKERGNVCNNKFIFSPISKEKKEKKVRLNDFRYFLEMYYIPYKNLIRFY